jgi:hypothetical protein
MISKAGLGKGLRIKRDRCGLREREGAKLFSVVRQSSSRGKTRCGSCESPPSLRGRMTTMIGPRAPATQNERRTYFSPNSGLTLWNHPHYELTRQVHPRGQRISVGMRRPQMKSRVFSSKKNTFESNSSFSRSRHWIQFISYNQSRASNCRIDLKWHLISCFISQKKKLINEFAVRYLPNFKPVPKAKSSLDFERSKRCNKSGISIYDSRSSPLCAPESSWCSREQDFFRIPRI